MGLSASQARMLSLTARLSDLELRAQTISNEKIRLSDQSEGASKKYSDALDKQTMKVYSGLQSNGTSSYVDATVKNLTTNGSISNTDKYRYLKTSSGQAVLTQQLAKLIDLGGAISPTDVNCDHIMQTLSNFLINCKDAGLVADPTNTSASDVIYYTKLWNEVTENGTPVPFGFTGNYITADGDNASTTPNENSSQWLQTQIDAGNISLYEYDSTAGTAGTGDYVNVSWTSGDATLSEVTDTTDTAKAEAEYETTMASIQSKDKRFDMQLSNIDTEHTATQTEIDSVKKVINKNIDRSFKIFDA